MQKVLVLVFADLNYDARVTRQIRWLTENYSVTVVCFSGRKDLPHVKFEEISMTQLTIVRKLGLALALFFKLFGLANKIQHGYFNDLRHLKGFDFIVANDVETLPLAFQLSTNGKVIFDAHEYAPRHFEDKAWWKLLFAPWYHHLCKRYIPAVVGMTTVSSGLADEYENNYGTRPLITTNATRYHDLKPQPISKPIRLVHHGIINKSRKIEKMVEMMKVLGADYTLDFILMAPEYASSATQEYFDDLKLSIQDIKNVTILPPLSNEDIVPTINKYDIGLFLLEPVNFNYTYALPNKLYDFVQARLAIAIGPSVEMTKVVNEYKLGVVSDSFEPNSLAKEIAKLTAEDITKYKLNAHENARVLSEEENKSTFLTQLN
ncbi:hypothetical protein [Roseivirga sp. E12]|uniref:hypothetical protein n=1 Tax=Roseivirga sp. E12 TaxID=2819237 RepID=UPI001ABC3D2F|nr:hypothetical protein [Roseivirga sp. E12]MBO3697992.1 hypothetical protein [Roseivirga sp. E12]